MHDSGTTSLVFPLPFRVGEYLSEHRQDKVFSLVLHRTRRNIPDIHAIHRLISTTLVYYFDYDLMIPDVTSTYFEGRTCPLARRGYSRDGKRDKLQILFGLLCAKDGCPIAVEVFEGNVADPITLAAQVEKLKRRLSPSGNGGSASK